MPGEYPSDEVPVRQLLTCSSSGMAFTVNNMQRELRWLIRMLDVIANSSGFEVARRMFMLGHPGAEGWIPKYRLLTREMLQIHHHANRNTASVKM